MVKYMNENIGARGGKNDRKRSLAISRKKLKKIKELKKLEKEVKNIQIKNALTVVPIVIVGNVLETLLNITKKEAKSPLILPKSDSTNFKKITFIMPDENNNLIEVTLKKEDYKNKIFKVESNDTKKVIKILKEHPEVVEKIEIVNKDKGVEVKEVKQDAIQIIETPINKKNIEDIVLTEIPQIDNAINHKIAEEYTKNMKEVRSELRELEYEYDVIADNYENIYESKEIALLINKLNDLIKKLESLKDKIELPKGLESDNYISHLVNEYMDEFDKNNLVNEIKDSNLYINISKKLDELNNIKDNLTVNLEDRKDKLEINENRLEELKDKYSGIEDFNSEIKNIVKNQQSILKELKDKVANAKTTTHAVQIKATTISSQNRRIRNMMARNRRRGARGANRLAILAATSINFIRNVINPQYETRTITNTNVIDYSKDIENEISNIEKSLSRLIRVSKELDKITEEVKKQFSDYIGKVKEIDNLLDELDQMKEQIKNQKEELEIIKEKEDKNLKTNNYQVQYVKKI